MNNTTDLQYRLGPCDDGEYVSALAGAGSGAAARDDLPPMRILWVKVGGLWPIDTGGRLRSFNLIKELSRHHDVSVITTHHPLEEHNDLPAQLPRCSKVVSLEHASVKRTSPWFLLSLLRSWFTPLPVDLYKSRIDSLEQQVRQALDEGDFDLCVVDFLFAAPNVPLKGGTPTVFFAHNVEYMIWQRLCRIDSNPLRRALLGLEWRKMKRYETNVCAAAALTIAVSAEDRDQLAHEAKDGRFRAIATGVDVDYFKRNPAVVENPLELVFTGSMDWHPNEDAILYFIDSVLPLIRRECPGVSFTVAGRNPGRKLLAAAREAKVTMTGSVADIRPYVDKAAVYVVPLRVGGGTRLKIFEALAMGKAVVSTTIGAEGLPLEEGVHVVRADTPERFAMAVVSLLRDPAARERLGRHGRELMEAKFSWPSVARDFAAHCREVARR